MYTRFVVSFLLSAVLVSSVRAEKRPNILWITAEDMSPALGCYGDHHAVTPNIDALALKSIRYTRAFATAPVCSPVRSTLITGCYAPTTGTHNMRSAFPLPKGIRGFPAYLRDSGYFTTNNSKTDYNTSDAERLIQESWDECSDTAHWRHRPDKDAPFFSVFNLMTSHQSRTMVWPYARFRDEVQSRLSAEQIHSPDQIPVPPYYPDTPLIRQEWARFYDCVTAMDLDVGNILEQLQQDNLDHNTIVFFFSDHGSGMPRHKRCLWDTGMHVPLLIHFPSRWQHLAPESPGSSIDQLVSFVDFPPTVFSLLELPIPEHCQGNAFLGPQAGAARRFAFGHRDRVDEAFDCSRSVRSNRYLYIRNFMSQHSYHQPTAWPDQGRIRAEIDRLSNQETMTPAQWQYASPTKAVEELYDCQVDPLNLTNLASDPPHDSILKEMRQTLTQHLTTTSDLGFVPEAVLKAAMTSHLPRNSTSLKSLAQSFQGQARHVGFADADYFAQNPLRFWNAVGLRVAGIDAETESKLMEDWRQWSGSVIQSDPVGGSESLSAGIELAGALVHYRQDGNALRCLEHLTRHDDLNVVLHATRTIELLGPEARNAIPSMKDVADRCRSILPASTTATFVQTPEQDLAMFINFSATSFLRRVAGIK